MPKETQKAIQKHMLLESLLYHLAPGILIGAGYYVLAPVVQRAGYPSVMALIMAALFILVPVQLGVLLWHGKRPNSKLSLAGVLGVLRYREPLP